MRSRLLVILLAALLLGPAPQLSPAGIIGISGGARLYVAPPNDDPFDLSAYTFPYTITWPTPPTTSSTVEVDTCGEFQSAVGSSNVLINVAAGTYSSCNLSVTGDDIDIVMSNSATLEGNVTIDAGNGDRPERIRWTGGNIDGTTQMNWRSVRDLLVDDVHIDGSISIHYNTTDTTSAVRFALINSTVDGRTDNEAYPVQIQWSSGEAFHEDLIFANVLVFGSTNSPIRIQGAYRTTIVESYFNGLDPDGGTTGLRIGVASRYFAIRGTIGVKPTVSIGRNTFDYNDGSPEVYSVRDVSIDGYVRYNSNALGGGVQIFNNDADNTGTVANLTSYADSGVGSQPITISPFTTGANVLDVQSWDSSTRPSTSAYGAQR